MISKRSIFCYFCLISCVLFLFPQSTGAASNRTVADTSSVIPIYLVDGAYGDFDYDTEIDDFCIWIKFDFTSWNLVKNVRVNMLMIVTLPSGLQYFFSIDVWTRAYGERTLQVICYNGAIESGWYEVELYGTINGLGSIDPINDFIIFDPPQPKGSGSPEVDATWVC
ncbi:MAG: hypothetical protein ACTSP4_13250 [Candidatus Hodarchaeales archaeon]